MTEVFTDSDNEISVESVSNRKDDSLPYRFYNPASEGKVTWTCGEDQNGDIFSVFCCKDPRNDINEKVVSQLNSDGASLETALKKAKEIREELILNGWNKTRDPEISFTVPDQRTGAQRPMNRKERRHLARNIKKGKAI